VNYSSKGNKLSDVSLANVEALANGGEASGPCPNAAVSWDNDGILNDDRTFVRCGSDCPLASGHNVQYGC